ncbi:MAG: helix-turn-helix domain-containing protein [Solobacterium sp.]|nr:helix-turn-helix domain-containing protein [Solobacterium sp.]
MSSASDTISMEALAKICDALQCEITDVIELTEDP